MNSESPFWESKSLLDMSHSEWESICDGCAKCCLTKLQDEETDLLVFTNIACDLLDGDSCRCTDYPNRTAKVPGCVAMNRNNIHDVVEFAPSSCSYSLLLSGESLPEWHHLVSGSKELVHEEGNSVSKRVLYAGEIEDDDLESYVVDWV